MGQLFLAQLGAMGAQELAKLAGCPDWVQELIAFGVGVTIYGAGDAFFLKIGDTLVAIPESTAREISGVASGDILMSNLGNLTAEEKAAIEKYTGPDCYQNINATLRGLDSFDPENVEISQSIKDALSKLRLPEDITVYRGTSMSALGDLSNLTPEEMIGEDLKEPAFMSTTTDSNEAFSAKVQMTIHAPAGAEAANISSLSEFAYENEILFNVGQEMTITSAYYDGDGILHITVDLK